MTVRITIPLGITITMLTIGTSITMITTISIYCDEYYYNCSS